MMVSAVMTAFLKKTGVQLWIQHDFVGNAKLKRNRPLIMHPWQLYLLGSDLG
jgi:hypothetical protein